MLVLLVRVAIAIFDIRQAARAVVVVIRSTQTVVGHQVAHDEQVADQLGLFAARRLFEGVRLASAAVSSDAAAKLPARRAVLVVGIRGADAAIAAAIARAHVHKERVDARRLGFAAHLARVDVVCKSAARVCIADVALDATWRFAATATAAVVDIDVVVGLFVRAEVAI